MRERYGYFSIDASAAQSIDLGYTGRREITLDTDAVGGDMMKSERHAIFIRHRSS